MNTDKKITRTTFKTFIKKNYGNLFIDVRSDFNGMTDCVEMVEGGFEKAVIENEHSEHTFGIRGAWLVNRGRDYFKSYEDEVYTGIYISNCCGSFTVAIRK